jgi:DNA-binding transcriptional regulator YdaS (Cro superfamily)
MHRDRALQQAIDAAGAGKALASRIGVTPQALSQWHRVPARRVLDVERASGVPRHALRPDLYPDEETAE